MPFPPPPPPPNPHPSCSASPRQFWCQTDAQVCGNLGWLIQGTLCQFLVFGDCKHCLSVCWLKEVSMRLMHAGGSGGSGTARRLHMLDRSLYQTAIFVPPGYTSLLYAHGYEDNSCPYNTALFKVIFIIQPPHPMLGCWTCTSL